MIFITLERFGECILKISRHKNKFSVILCMFSFSCDRFTLKKTKRGPVNIFRENRSNNLHENSLFLEFNDNIYHDFLVQKHPFTISALQFSSMNVTLFCGSPSLVHLSNPHVMF